MFFYFQSACLNSSVKHTIVDFRRGFQQQLQHGHKIDKSVTRPRSATCLSKIMSNVLKNSTEFNYRVKSR